jgi:hypothetical protein
MPGNEQQILNFFFKIKNTDIKFKHLGKIISVKIPFKNQLIELNRDNLDKFFSDDSSKKADLYINNIGCSLKQKGGNFPFNRMQRKNMNNFLSKFFNDQKIVNTIIFKIDKKIKLFHSNKIIRNFKFMDVMNESEFKIILKYLMTEGSPNVGKTSFSAKYILEAKEKVKSYKDLTIYTFDEYFSDKKDKISFAIRRHWVGQKSASENKRAIGLFKNKENEPWCFNDSVGKPTKGWDTKIDEKERKTAYTLSIEQK